MKTILVALNEEGRRIGETHHNSRIPDSMVDHMRDLHEYEGMSCKKIAAKLSISLRTVEKICKYERRAQRAERWKRMPITDVCPSHRQEVLRPVKRIKNTVSQCPDFWAQLPLLSGLGAYGAVTIN